METRIKYNQLPRGSQRSATDTELLTPVIEEKKTGRGGLTAASGLLILLQGGRLWAPRWLVLYWQRRREREMEIPAGSISAGVR